MTGQATPPLDEVLERIAVRGTDPGVVTDYAMGMIASRAKRRRIIGGSAAVLGVTATTVFALMGNSGSGTDEVVTPADPVTSTEVPARTRESATAAPSSTVPGTTIAVVTVPPSTTTTTGLLPPPAIAPPAPSVVPVTPVPNTTAGILVDRPGSATLTVTSGVAGELLDLRFEFEDPDGPGVSPTMWIHTDEPGIVEPRLDTSDSGPCSGGPGTTGRLHEPVQFASTGLRRVWVTVKYCNALPSVFSTTLDVADPRFGNGPGRAVMAEVPGATETLDGGEWQLRTDGGETLAVGPAGDDYTHQLEPVAGFRLRGVVIVLPASTTGELILTTSGPESRVYAGRVNASPSGGAAQRVPMTLR